MAINTLEVVIPYYLSLRYNINFMTFLLYNVVIPYYLSLRYNCFFDIFLIFVVVIPYYLSLRYNRLERRNTNE